MLELRICFQGTPLIVLSASLEIQAPVFTAGIAFVTNLYAGSIFITLFHVFCFRLKASLFENYTQCFLFQKHLLGF